jgi:hypothetical protein
VILKDRQAVEAAHRDPAYLPARAKVDRLSVMEGKGRRLFLNRR